MKIYLSIFRIRLLNLMQYRAVAIGEIGMRFVWGFMEITAYLALYRTSGGGFPMELSQTVSYIWMQQVFYVFFSVVFGDNEILESISSGAIAYELVRPMNLYGRWFSQSLANRLSYTVLNCLPALIFAFILPKPYRITLPAGVSQMIFFLLSMVLALCIVVEFAMLLYISLFYTLSHRGMKIIVTAVTSFLSGGVIPLPFFPEAILAVINLLPFAAMQNMPLLIFNGKLTGTGMISGIVFQLFWLAVLYAAGQMGMRAALKKVVVQGG